MMTESGTFFQDKNYQTLSGFEPVTRRICSDRITTVLPRLHYVYQIFVNIALHPKNISGCEIKLLQSIF